MGNKLLSNHAVRTTAKLLLGFCPALGGSDQRERRGRSPPFVCRFNLLGSNGRFVGVALAGLAAVLAQACPQSTPSGEPQCGDKWVLIDSQCVQTCDVHHIPTECLEGTVCRYGFCLTPDSDVHRDASLPDDRETHRPEGGPVPDVIPEVARIDVGGGEACLEVTPEKITFFDVYEGGTQTVQVRLTNCGGVGLELVKIAAVVYSGPETAFELDLGPAGHTATPWDPLTIPVGDSDSFLLSYNGGSCTGWDCPEEPGGGVVLIEAEAGGELSIAMEIPFSVSNKAMPECPIPKITCQEGKVAWPPTVLHLQSGLSYSPTGPLTNWQWSVKKPANSLGLFSPTDTFPNPTFNIDVPGTFKFYLNVWDEGGITCGADVFEVEAIPTSYALQIEVLWDNPEDPDQNDTGPEAGADVDLHFLHPDAGGPDLDGDGQPDGWFDIPWDCFWFNAHTVAWGNPEEGTEDDPDLDVDDSDGAGPEILNYVSPEPLKYKLGVHYWNDHGYGKAYVTVRVFMAGELTFEVTDVGLIDSDMWEVAVIDMATGTVQVVTDAMGQYKFTPEYHNPYFFQ